jgi:acetyl esterase/lipase
MVFIHGGYWRARYDLEHAGFLCQALAKAGIAVWNIEYRRLGNSGGGYPGTFQDAARAIAFTHQLAEQFALDTKQGVAVMGHSAGGHLALWVASARRFPPGHPLHAPDLPPLRAAICLGGITDLRRAWEFGLSDQAVTELLGGGPDQVPERYAAVSPMERLPLRVRQIIVHGTDEEVVPTEFATRYVEAARTAGDDIALLWLPGMGHFEPIDPRSAAWPIVYGAVTQALCQR